MPGRGCGRWGAGAVPGAALEVGVKPECKHRVSFIPLEGLLQIFRVFLVCPLPPAAGLGSSGGIQAVLTGCCLSPVSPFPSIWDS